MTKKNNASAVNQPTKDAQQAIQEIMDRVKIKEGVGARSKVEKEMLGKNSISWSSISSNKKRVVDPSLPKIIIVGKRISKKLSKPTNNVTKSKYGNPTKRAIERAESQSVTFERQFNEIEKLAKNDGISLEGCIIIEDQVSGWKRKYRREFDALIKFIEEFEGANPIYVYFYDLDRLTRNEQVAALVFPLLRRQNVILRLATMPDLNIHDTQSDLIINLLTQLAQAESKKTSLRTTGGQEIRANKGAWRTSVAPYGMSVGKKLIDGVERSVLQPGDNADVVREIFRRFNLGDSINDIVRYLNNSQIKAPGTASIWRDSTISYMLLNPNYAGYTRYNTQRSVKKIDVEKQIVKDDNGNYLITHQGIIEPEVFWLTKAIIQSKHTKRKKTRHVHMLSGLLYCTDCNAKMFGNKSSVDSYRCPDATRYDNLKPNSISCKGIDEVIKRLAKQIITNPKRLESMMPKSVVNLEEEEKERQRLIATIKTIEDKIAAEELDEVKDGLRLALSKQTKKLIELNSNTELNTKLANKALISLESFEELWNNKDKTAVQIALMALIERIDIEPLGDRKKLNNTLLRQKRWLFDYTRVTICWADGTKTQLADEFENGNQALVA